MFDIYSKYFKCGAIGCIGLCEISYFKKCLLFRHAEIKSDVACTKPTFQNFSNCSTTLPKNVRVISKKDIKNAVRSNYFVVGKGAFGKCINTQLGPLDVCLKIFIGHGTSNDASDSHFFNETTMLSLFCHPNLPWLFGVNDCDIKVIVMSYITFHGSSLNVFEALYKADKTSSSLTSSHWKSILFGIASALVHLVNQKILHNDIKCDNILIKSATESVCTGVLVDFGKACFKEAGRKYHLSPSLQQEYLKNHPQVPPDVVAGESVQSHASDIYSFGRVLMAINTKKLDISMLQSLGSFCMDRDPLKRPSIQDIYTSFHNLFDL